MYCFTVSSKTGSHETKKGDHNFSTEEYFAYLILLGMYVERGKVVTPASVPVLV